MKLRRKGDLFPNASAVASCVTRRGCTRSALVRRDLSLELGKPRTKSLERNVCLFPLVFSVAISSLITDLPLREALYSDRSGSTQRSQGRPHLFKYDADFPSSPTPERYVPSIIIFSCPPNTHPSRVPLARSCLLAESLPVQRCMELRVQNVFCVRRAVLK
jgi:hypothetical protein